MKYVRESDLIRLYKYATRETMLYARFCFDVGYDDFLRDLEVKMRNGEIALDQAFTHIDDFNHSNRVQESGNEIHQGR